MIKTTFTALSLLTFANLANAANLSVGGLGAGVYTKHYLQGSTDESVTIASAIQTVAVGLTYDSAFQSCMLMTVRDNTISNPAEWETPVGPGPIAPSGPIAGAKITPSGTFHGQIVFAPGSITNDIQVVVNPTNYANTYEFLYTPVGGSSAATPSLTLSISLTDLSQETDYSTCFPGITPSASSGGSASTASATIIQSDVSRVTRSAVTANNSMMSQGLERFIGDRNSGMSLTDAISTSGLNSVVVSPEMQAYGETLFGGGSFFGQSVSADGTYRKVTFGEFDVQHERGAGTTLSFNGRMAWERAAGEDAMVAYFLGAEVNRSNIEGS